MNPYIYDKNKSQPNLQLKQTTRHWSHYLVDFPTTHSTIWLWYPIIRGKIIRFLKSTFNIR
jgi:hypothetical protein